MGNIYRPPKAGKELLVDVNHMLDSSERKEVILMGDMNINLLKASRTSQIDELLLITKDHGLTQLISEPDTLTTPDRLLTFSFVPTMTSSR